MKYNEWKTMDKQAGFPALLAAVPGFFEQAGWLGAVLLASAAGVGGAGGYMAAKLNAKDKRDISTIQKEYENERLKSDLGYLSAKVNEEYNKQQNQTKPKAARVIA